MQKHFEQQGYNVEIHDSNGDPDQDFLYLCFAPHLIAGGGSGYANLAKKIHHDVQIKNYLNASYLELNETRI
mgnify:CR=1 FL=1